MEWNGGGGPEFQKGGPSIDSGVANRYFAGKIIGSGAYGTVISAVDNVTGEEVAVKRISNVLKDYPSATRALREIKFLRMLQAHPNIVTVRDVLVPEMRENFRDVYVVCEKFPGDLGKILKSQTDLRKGHIKFIMFQILCGIDFLHRAKVFHRDLKPGNILLNSKCHVSICDFGLARAVVEGHSEELIWWTDYVATRWYRAPELILVHMAHYSTAIDMWSVGCIFAEILSRGEPLFPGRTIEEQFDLITQVTGTPSPALIAKLRTQKAREVVASLPRREGIPLRTLFPNAEDDELALLSGMLTFDPAQRISAQEALSSPYFAEFRDAYKERFVEAPVFSSDDFSFERHRLSEPQMRQEYLKEVAFYHPQVLEATEQKGNYAMESEARRMDMQMKHVEVDASFRQTQTMPKENTGDAEPEVQSSILQEAAKR
uniref:Protein kinase domain-containing protein n=6 Tax=Rhodosorus marinus TaxID=101924 RepID=A0A7S3A3T9_9RHOD|mmetsp:Transcript_43668/g.170872  ORF Transcript_43668/g.170872 Transcript_43668/m.170872 type:complete len:431 (+) Transcript_43668:157-1449(+)